MDNATSGLTDGCWTEHTADSTLRFQLLSNRESSSNRPTGRLTENAKPAASTDTALPTSTSEGSTLSGNFHVNLMEAADNSQPARAPPPRRIQSQPRRANGSNAQLDFTAEYLAESLRQASLPPCMSDYIVESLETTNNSLLATEQGVTRATEALLHRAREERAVREQQLIV
ncbi:hypothetical protein ACROYT_G023445 [Oculina patagonica]